MVAITRRMKYANMSGLAHIPKDRERRFDDAGHVLAPRLVAFEEAGRHIDDLLHRGLVEFGDHLLLGGEVGGGIPLGDLALYGVGFRPAEPGGVAAGVE